MRSVSLCLLIAGLCLLPGCGLKGELHHPDPAAEQQK